MSRLIVISNRVAPIAEGKPTAGGLAVGVFDALKQAGGVWFGWNGEITEGSTAPEEVREESRDNITYATVGLSRSDYDLYYRGFSNGTLWPVFHYRPDLSRYDRREYAGYLKVNEWLVARLKPLLKPDDRLWVHDYHLLPFAQACRRAGIRNRIGFFLHIPFPAEQIMATVPPHRELVEAMCEYDQLGFQSDGDRRAFTDYVRRRMGGSRVVDRAIELDGKRIGVGAYPIGIYPDEIQKLSLKHSSSKQITNLKQGLLQRRLMLSVDRLDYSKGLLERFTAFERLLENKAEHRGKVSFIQIAPPSRSDVEQYRHIRRQLETAAGRINGRFSDLSWTPLRYINKSYDRSLLMSLFRASQVGYVTPLRDGMNLVAKEYVAAQPPDDPGVLVLSEFAGAAEELADGALLVNPYDTDGMADTLHRALTMPLPERLERYKTMLGRLNDNNLSHWRDRFLQDLEDSGTPG
ncbi:MULTISPECIES: alpha,alpha-trehalose-phosphate synthase (UDP-forming) [unclassified Achromobacter]|uniref:alpha,alpha-trehalose-phosphate synthase (UDP-forming) n=1 Tax=unclassified Achromobacter TaxID=2626865 RepID=UPI000B51BB79|nr:MULTISPECIES: alpha,alpha-trehalose-phosphate synthase (UDP-forming) [unclassified Achromobacter]OWT77312.1 alpha,alpha-trehalose-phosphate synthase (UDP-forming) [Achromobacter sp. HZ28]OWT78193.1 alpha,alpha-trehalose-phosphate synthase (UDP-forming) [Achromobacter sp. HZ34]